LVGMESHHYGAEIEEAHCLTQGPIIFAAPVSVYVEASPEIENPAAFHHPRTL
jgi:hypothetical protein